MKNKILASLLAVCLFVGLAVPAFAYSSQSGVDADITALTFKDASYTIKNGAAAKDLAAEVTAFVGTKKIVQEPTLEWSIANDSKFAFSISDAGLVSSVEDAGTAVVTVTANDGKVKATVKLVAEKAAPAAVEANGFTFKASSYTLLTGNDAASAHNAPVEITVIPTPVGAYFTVAQQNQIAAEAADLVPTGLALATPSVTKASDKVVFTFANGVAKVDAVTGAAAKYTVDLTGMTAGTITKAFGQTVTVAYTTDVPTTATALAAALTVPGFAFTASGNVVTMTASAVGAITPANDTIYKTALVGATGITSAAVTVATVGVNAVTAVTATELCAITQDALAAKVLALDVPVFTIAAANNTTRDIAIKRTVSIATKKASIANTINAAGNKVIEVGEKANIANLFKQGPSKSNVVYPVSYTQDFLDNNATALDYVDFTSAKGDIIGVAVGKNKIVATTAAGTASIIVEVVEKGKKPVAVKPSLNPTANLIVGGTHKIAVKDAGAAAITFSSYDAKIATVATDGTIKAIAEGTTKIKVEIAGSDTLYVTVKVAKAPAVVDPTKPTDVPKTGVSFFSF